MRREPHARPNRLSSFTAGCKSVSWQRQARAAPSKALSTLHFPTKLLYCAVCTLFLMCTLRSQGANGAPVCSLCEAHEVHILTGNNNGTRVQQWTVRLH
jgi:hypothetical protein